MAFDSRLETMRSIWMRSTSAGTLARQIGRQPNARFFVRNLKLIDHIRHQLAIDPARVFCSASCPDSACDSSSSARTICDKPLDILQRVEHGLAILLRGRGREQAPLRAGREWP